VNGPFTQFNREIRGSAIVRSLDAALPQPPSLLAEVRRFLNQHGFPDVFAGLPPAPAGPVHMPSEAQARQAFQAAAPSSVRIVGSACGEVLSGSGFVVSGDNVVTNAHVVAGVEAPQVQQQDGSDQQFLLADGAVAGVVFQASTTHPSVGDAIASTDVIPDVDRAARRTRPVSTGGCVR